MRLTATLLSVGLVAFVACDDDDPDDVADGCREEAAFLVDGDARCVSGFGQTTNFGQPLTTLTLTGIDDELLSITVTGIREGTFDLPVGSASYVAPDGTAYVSESGGQLVVTELDDELDGTFAFEASNAAGRVAITSGVIENLGFR